MDKLEIKQGSFIQQTQYFIPESQKRFNERKYKYLKYKNKNHSGTDTYKLSDINLAPNLILSFVQNPTSVFTGIGQMLMSRPGHPSNASSPNPW
jgi:hypothetical protein